ncbi:MAG TPA: class I SAM-dependent methyltransferase [Dehalococcoidia bacterium]|nr:class I SAM-dependent methyltransferase [Dehalococcoidia bacterium]
MTHQPNTFDKWALTYDKDLEKANDSDDWMFGDYYCILDKVVEYCELEKYENPQVLDIGAGTGNLSIKFLEKKLMVTAIDPSKKMREICKGKYPDLVVLQGDFLDIPLPSESIDIIVSSFAFHHLTETEKAVSVLLMRDILHSGGRIVIADLMFKNPVEKDRIRQKLLDPEQARKFDEIDEEYPAYFDDLEMVFQRKGFNFRGEPLTKSVWILCACLGYR